MADAIDPLTSLRLRWALEDHPWLVDAYGDGDFQVGPDGSINFCGEIPTNVPDAEAGLCALANALGYQLEEVREGYVSLQPPVSKDSMMRIHDTTATVTAKGQVTIPKDVRLALGIAEGDSVLFRVADGVAVLARTPELLDLAGAVPIPATAADLTWPEERDRATARQAERGR